MIHHIIRVCAYINITCALTFSRIPSLDERNVISIWKSYFNSKDRFHYYPRKQSTVGTCVTQVAEDDGLKRTDVDKNSKFKSRESRTICSPAIRSDLYKWSV